jgi:hypothetical protein
MRYDSPCFNDACPLNTCSRFSTRAKKTRKIQRQNTSMQSQKCRIEERKQPSSSRKFAVTKCGFDSERRSEKNGSRNWVRTSDGYRLRSHVQAENTPSHITGDALDPLNVMKTTAGFWSNKSRLSPTRRSKLVST